MKNVKTLKEIAEILNISEQKASKIKTKIEITEFCNIPSYMIWGTGKNKYYNTDKFKYYLENKIGSKKPKKTLL
jgi:hypothetical protein